MTSERTEKPTPKKLREARKKGQVAKSQELCGAVILLGGVLLIYFFANLLNLRIKKLFVDQFSALNSEHILSQIPRAFFPIIFPVVSIMVGIAAVAISIHFFQTGVIWKKPKRSKRGGQFFYRVGYGCAKLAVVAVIGYFVLWLHRFDFGGTLFMVIGQKQQTLFKKVFSLSCEVGIGLLILALFDFFYQKFRFIQQMKMTKQEVKEERRESEGDPQIKAERRRRRQEK